MIYPLLVNPRQLEKLHDVNAAVPAFALRHEIRRTSHQGGDFVLRQTGMFTSGDKPLQQRIVGLLKLGGSRLS